MRLACAIFNHAVILLPDGCPATRVENASAAGLRSAAVNRVLKHWAKISFINDIESIAEH
jgi:hypothetical protein